MKVFTVTKPGGLGDLDFQAYYRQLMAWKVDVTDMPRILEPGTPNRWLYAWEDRAEAERFANELRLQGRAKDRAWRVEARETDRVERGPLGPVVIEVGPQTDGCTYGLHPYSQILIDKKYPQARQVRAVFVGVARGKVLGGEQQQSIWDHVAHILTGLSEDQLNDLGGYRIYDPVEKAVWREAPALAL
jgi:hypothetical protein